MQKLMRALVIFFYLLIIGVMSMLGLIFAVVDIIASLWERKNAS